MNDARGADMTTPVLILAGGSSSRMAPRNKLLENVDGHPLLRLQAWRALKASRDVTVLLRPNQPALKTALDGLPVRILTANEALEGMGGSIRAGTRSLQNAPCFLMLLADLVDIEAEDMRRVMSAREAKTGAVAWRGTTEDGKPGHPILFDSALYPELMELSGDQGAKAVLSCYADQIVDVPLPGQRARTDLDSPDDWLLWRSNSA